jgi:hypothetical protein
MSLRPNCPDDVYEANSHSFDGVAQELRGTKYDEDSALLQERLKRCMLLFRFPRFRRVWMLQAVGLARQGIVVWSDFSTNWPAIGTAGLFILRFCKHQLHVLELTDDSKRANEMYTTFGPSPVLRNSLLSSHQPARQSLLTSRTLPLPLQRRRHARRARLHTPSPISISTPSSPGRSSRKKTHSRSSAPCNTTPAPARSKEKKGEE